MQKRSILITFLAAAAATGAIVVAVVAATALLPASPAGAGVSGPCRAFVGGVSSAKGAVPELVVFNTQTGQLTLSLRIVAADGTVLADRADEIPVGPLQTVTVDLLEQLRRGLTGNQKPYAGTFAVEVSGPQGFSGDNFLVHVTQYFGSRAKPKAAYVLRPVFVEEAP